MALISIQTFNFREENIEPRKKNRTGVAYKWDDTFKAEFLNAISRDIQNLNGSVSRKINLNCDPNDVVSEF